MWKIVEIRQSEALFFSKGIATFYKIPLFSYPVVVLLLWQRAAYYSAASYRV